MCLQKHCKALRSQSHEPCLYLHENPDLKQNQLHLLHMNQADILFLRQSLWQACLLFRIFFQRYIFFSHLNISPLEMSISQDIIEYQQKWLDCMQALKFQHFNHRYASNHLIKPINFYCLSCLPERSISL